MKQAEGKRTIRAAQLNHNQAINTTTFHCISIVSGSHNHLKMYAHTYTYTKRQTHPLNTHIYTMASVTGSFQMKKGVCCITTKGSIL